MTTTVNHSYVIRVLSTFFLLSLGLYVLLATVTYTPFDPGWMHISSDTRQVSNAAGVTGAWLADLLYGFFGWAALLLPLFLCYECIQVWWPRSYLPKPIRYMAQFFILIITAALLSCVWQIPNDSLANASGGIIGLEIASSLSHTVSTAGAIAILGIFSILLWTLVFKIRWLQTGQFLRQLPQTLQELFYKNPSADVPQTVATTPSAPQSAAYLAELAALDTDDETERKKDAANTQTTSSVQSTTDTATSTIATAPPDDVVPEMVNIHDVLASSAQVTDTSTKIIQETTTAIPEVIAQMPTAEPRTVAQHDPIINDMAPINAQLIDEVEQLLAEAEYHLQKTNDETALSASQTAVRQPHSSQTALDWEDDKVLDDLLAAIPPTVKPTEQTVPQNLTENQNLAETPNESSQDNILQTSLSQGLSTSRIEPNNDATQNVAKSNLAVDLEGVLEENPVYVQSQPQTQENTSMSEKSEPKTLSSSATELLHDIDFDDEFYGDVQEPNSENINEQGKEKFDSPVEDEDWDKPLTDHLGRPVSRAFQTVAKRQQLSTLPEITLLDPPSAQKVSYTAEQLSRLGELLTIKLQDFNIKATVVDVQPGPVVTRFELDLAPGVRASKVTNIANDLARSMSMEKVRVVEVIKGKPYIGIEIPNAKREMVRLIELLQTEEYRDPNALISIALGKDVAGKPVLSDLAKTPHMLVAGTTGSGKSVAVNAMLLSMLLKYTPEQLRLILIDPKQLELANYNDIPHLLTPVVTDMSDAVSALNWCVNEMERRYKLMSLLKVRKIVDYNRKVSDALQRGEDLIDPTWQPTDSALQDKAPRLQPLPMIVVVADEFADMIMQVGKKAEEMITRLAQKSRAAGIHLLLATQRPSVDVITGLIKANIPTRVALRVNSKIDSRTILDAGGAEDLLGHGDMLFLAPGKIEPERVHGAFISDDEVNRICDAWRERGFPNYIDEILTPYDEDHGGGLGEDFTSSNPDKDVLYDQCVAFVLESKKTSASALQRKFSLGFNRASRIIDQMEADGILSPMGNNGRREILV